MAGGRAPQRGGGATSSFFASRQRKGALMGDSSDGVELADRASGLSESDALAYIGFSLLPVWTWRDLGERLRAGDPPAAALDRFLSKRPLKRGCPPCSLIELMLRAEAALASARAHGLVPIVWSDSAYPSALAAIVDPPPVLWTRGSLAAFDRPAVAIVGSRAASAYALEVAERLGADLAAQGVTVVSGLARGVDSAAHRGAVTAGGLTIAVLGCGADIIYPREHADLARRIEASGLILSELAPGTRPLPQFFPQRNRVISGLSRSVVIVEAGERSGSLITARCALDQGRDVLAVPGNILSGRNRGGHGPLRDGAKIVETADDILEELGICGAVNPALGQRSTSGMAPPGDPLLA